VRRASALLALLIVASCGHATVKNTVGSPSPTASTVPSASPSSPPTTKGPQPSTPAVTPQPATVYTAASGVNGQTVAGPTCPVERAGHPCPPRPVTDATVTARGPQTKSTHTDAKGDFTLKLDPGSYDVSADSKSSFSCKTQRVQVVAHRYTHVTINCDTGIR
jgi:hypothetical protein